MCFGDPADLRAFVGYIGVGGGAAHGVGAGCDPTIIIIIQQSTEALVIELGIVEDHGVFLVAVEQQNPDADKVAGRGEGTGGVLPVGGFCLEIKRQRLGGAVGEDVLKLHAKGSGGAGGFVDFSNGERLCPRAKDVGVAGLAADGDGLVEILILAGYDRSRCGFAAAPLRSDF